MTTGLKTPHRALAIGIFALGAALVVCGREIVVHHLFRGSIAGADAILGKTIPSVERLSSLRGKAHAVEILAMDMEAARTPLERAEIAHEIERLLATVEGEQASYEDLGAVRGEREKQAELRSAVTALRGAAARLVRSTGDPDPPGTTEALLSAAKEVERRNEGLILLNVTGACDATREIVERQEAAQRVSLVLFACVLALVTVGAWMTGRWIARADRETALRMAELDAFAARAAHDLKGPLSPAVLALSLLGRSRTLDEPGRRAIETIRRGHERLRAIIDGLLAFTRAGAVAHESDEATFVDEVVSDLGPALRSLALDEKADLRFDIEPGLHVAASKVVLGSILDNLIRNAILHLGDSARRRVTVRATSEGPDVVIAVADTGPGMTPDLLARLFVPFVRGSSRPGTGLGLAIVKRLVDAHGGGVTVCSEVGRGSSFNVRLPLALARSGSADRRAA
jgi:signal transduction histidine kinase